MQHLTQRLILHRPPTPASVLSGVGGGEREGSWAVPYFAHTNWDALRWALCKGRMSAGLSGHASSNGGGGRCTHKARLRSGTTTRINTIRNTIRFLLERARTPPRPLSVVTGMAVTSARDADVDEDEAKEQHGSKVVNQAEEEGVILQGGSGFTSRDGCTSPSPPPPSPSPAEAPYPLPNPHSLTHTNPHQPPHSY